MRRPAGSRAQIIQFGRRRPLARSTALGVGHALAAGQRPRDPRAHEEGVPAAAARM